MTQPKRVVNLSAERLEAVSTFIISAANTAQDEGGFTIDEVICSMLFMAGAMIRQRGGVLHCEMPLRESLPPIALGYETAEPAQAWQLHRINGL